MNAFGNFSYENSLSMLSERIINVESKICRLRNVDGETCNFTCGVRKILKHFQLILIENFIHRKCAALSVVTHLCICCSVLKLCQTVSANHGESNFLRIAHSDGERTR